MPNKGEMVQTLSNYTVKKLRHPTQMTLESDLQWVCHSLGFMGKRDLDNTAYKILRALMRSAKNKKGMTSEELTEKVKPTIGSVIYHLKKLMKAGLVVKFGSTYELRMESLVSTIDEIKKEINITLADIMKVAKDIDNKIGLDNR